MSPPGPLRVVINADDFGYDADTVHATIKSFRRGALTAASIMATMPATERACRFACAWPQSSFGAHLTLVRHTVERPVSKASDIPSLVDHGGALHRWQELRLRALGGRIKEDDVVREMTAQLGRVRDLGVRISHVVWNGQLYQFPVFCRALLRVLPAFGVQRVRNFRHVYLAVPWNSPAYWWERLRSSAVAQAGRTTDWFFTPTGQSAGAWPEQLMQRVPGGTLEVAIHPGQSEPWRAREANEAAHLAGLLCEAGVPMIGWDAV